ncbi:Uncharacterised protein [Mycobacteroides abscessus subsp. abscessus]|nr:Uncharacterised protein [Mycobacteroides abscessus subsp. abscessus]
MVAALSNQIRGLPLTVSDRMGKSARMAVTSKARASSWVGAAAGAPPRK